MDKEAARYFAKLHIIAGQMSMEQMYHLDTFYTLTGKSGEIFNKDKVRISQNFTPSSNTMTTPGLEGLG